MCKFLCLVFAFILPAWAESVAPFIAEARQKHGEAGEQAARFLAEHMPPSDQAALSKDFLIEHLDLAFEARKEFPWAAKVPEDLFFNDVLPYVVFDETRESWRKRLRDLLRPVVAGAPTATEAAQRINRELFKLIKVHYNTGRKAPNQSLSESMASGRATCTGLSIILVNACRSVGIPARAVGTPMWTSGRGNHTWVEIWDDGWHFTGADEYDPKGLNHGWFTQDAAKAVADQPEHAIYATSWKRDGLFFPMVWSPAKSDVAAVNVTDHYAKSDMVSAKHSTAVRLLKSPGSERIVARVRIIDENFAWLGEALTMAAPRDLNDMPRFEIPPGTKTRIFMTFEEETRELSHQVGNDAQSTVEAVWTQIPKTSPPLQSIIRWLEQEPTERRKESPLLAESLNKDEARIARALLGEDRLKELRTSRDQEMKQKVIQVGQKSLRWQEKTFGQAPEGGHSLWISMHGGGGAPAVVNDGQWNNQIRLYQPTEGIYVAPRAPTDTWNLWHEAHIDPMFDRLIENYVATRGVNPDKIYLLGYSAGGDGVWQLAPRMADRFAAAAMMAGHPNESSLLGLRNLPFAILMGANDHAYDRNKIAAQKVRELDELAQKDPGAYPHMSRIYEGLGHWMDRKDAEALPWMAGFKRQTWPKKIIWFQDDVVHQSFYWLSIPESAAKPGKQITATVNKQQITITGDVPSGMTLRLSDQLLNLDLPVTIIVNDSKPLQIQAKRTAKALLESLEERADIPAAASATVVIP
jgi:pimeloyl-ACP methyl ester carboxylesterase